MSKTIKLNYGGKKYLEQCPKISLKEIQKKLQKTLREEMLKLELGENIKLLYTQPHYGGWRAWFECPLCKKKASILYQRGEIFQCRKCTGLPYKKQRYRKMFEETIYKR